MRRGGQSQKSAAGAGGTRSARGRPAGGSGTLDRELSEALEELRVASEELHEQEALLDQASAEVTAQVQRYRELFDFAPDGYLVTGNDGVIEEANLAAMRMLGVDQRGLVGKPLMVHVAATDRRRMLRLLRVAASEPGVHEVELLLQPRRGEALSVSAHVTAALTDRRSPLRWLLRDITRRRDTERRLEEALRREQEVAARLRELDAIKSAFLLAVSHDLRGPVTAITALARILAEEPSPPPERRRRAAASIVANSARIEHVQRNLVDLDRLAGQAVVLQPGPVDIARLVADSITAADAADRPVSIRVEVDTAVLDAAVVERLLDNLLSNAVNHTPAGTPVEVAVESEPGGVLISVVDHGFGVPPLLREAIFKPFGVARSGLDDRGARGVGVGLHLVARFAELHGGRAWVEPTQGGGATFRVRLRGNP